jgi:hypothetical protein
VGRLVLIPAAVSWLLIEIADRNPRQLPKPFDD